MLKLLLDQGLPRRTAWDLRSRGFDVVHCGEEGLQAASDEELLDFAARSRRTVVTLDSDFSRLMSMRNSKRPSILHIRLERLNRQRATRLIGRLMKELEFELNAGVIASVTGRGIRIRDLPLP